MVLGLKPKPYVELMFLLSYVGVWCVFHVMCFPENAGTSYGQLMVARWSCIVGQYQQAPVLIFASSSSFQYFVVEFRMYNDSFHSLSWWTHFTLFMHWKIHWSCSSMLNELWQRCLLISFHRLMIILPKGCWIFCLDLCCCSRWSHCPVLSLILPYLVFSIGFWCMMTRKHTLVPGWLTPKRDHIKFPFADSPNEVMFFCSETQCLLVGVSAAWFSWHFCWNEEPKIKSAQFSIWLFLFVYGNESWFGAIG